MVNLTTPAHHIVFSHYCKNKDVVPRLTHTVSPIPTVNTNSLMCANIPEEDLESSALDNSTAVCGTNGITYPSLCQLIQDTGNEAVAYAGSCDRRECQGGPVSK